MLGADKWPLLVGVGFIVKDKNYLMEKILYLRRIYRMAMSIKKEIVPYYNFYSNAYCRYGVFFIHIPKAAGTSVSSLLYGYDVGHSTVNDYKAIIPLKKFNNINFFAVIRDPVERIISTYHYMKRRISIEDESHPFYLFSQHDNVSSLVMDERFEGLVKKNRFFWPTSHYIQGVDESKVVLLRFSHLNEDYLKLADAYKLPKILPNKNKHEGNKQSISENASDHIIKLYHEDYKLLERY